MKLSGTPSTSTGESSAARANAPTIARGRRTVTATTDAGSLLSFTAASTARLIMSAKLVIVESPYAGDVELNVRYARAAVRDCLMRGEAPFASHLIYTQNGVLNDMIEIERAHGIHAGFAWRMAADATVFYTDLGWSNGMGMAMEHIQQHGLPHEYRYIDQSWR